MANTFAKREKLWQKIQGVGLFVLGVICVISAIVGASAYNVKDDSPFYIGGFIAGPLAILGGLAALYIGLKLGEDSKFTQNRANVCFTIYKWTFSQILIASCVIGIVFAGVFGIGHDGKDRSSIKSLSFVLISCFLTLIALSMINIVFTYFCKAPEHGHVVRGVHRGHSIAPDPSVHIHNTNIFTVDSSRSHVRDLEEQNRLLQEQVRIQQLLLEQKTRQLPSHQRHQQQPQNDDNPPSYNSVMRENSTRPLYTN